MRIGRGYLATLHKEQEEMNLAELSKGLIAPILIALIGCTAAAILKSERVAIAALAGGAGAYQVRETRRDYPEPTHPGEEHDPF